MTRYWQDLTAGEQFNTDSLTVSRDDILDFAAEFDPQPYHLDSSAADESIFGGLCASGWQVSALMMRLLTDCFRNQHIAIMGVKAVQKMRWKIPVFAGDSLRASIVLGESSGTPGQSEPGIINAEVSVSNQTGKPVVQLTARLLIAMSTLEQEQAHAG